MKLRWAGFSVSGIAGNNLDLLLQTSFKLSCAKAHRWE